MDGQDYPLLSTDLVQADSEGRKLSEYLDEMRSGISTLDETIKADIADLTKSTGENIDNVNKALAESIGNVKTALTESIGNLTTAEGEHYEEVKTSIADLDKSIGERLDNLGETVDGIGWEDVAVGDKTLSFTDPVGTVTSEMIRKAGGAYVMDVDGKTVKEVLLSLFASEKNPEMVAPVVNFSFTSANTSYEVGTEITPVVKTTMASAGSYTYGPYDSTTTGVTISAIEINNNAGESFSTETATFASFTVEDDTNYVISCSATTSAATAYGKTNIGNKSTVLIPSKTFTASRTVKGYRNYYYGWYADYLTTLTAAQVKAKKKVTALSIQSQTLDIATQTFFVAFPASLGRKSVSLTNVTANGPIKVNDPITVSIGGVNDHSPVDYYVYIANGKIDKGTKIAIKIS